MRIVTKNSLAGNVAPQQAAQMASVSPIRQGGGPDAVPALMAAMNKLQADNAELAKKLGGLIQAHNATVGELTKLKSAHNAVARGASSLAKHFQGFVAASQIQYTPAVVQRQAPQAQQASAPRAAPQAAPRVAPPAAQVVDVEPAAENNPWAQRDAAFYEGGEGEEG